MAFAFSDGFDELESGRLKLRILLKESGNEREIPYYWYEIRRKPDMTPVGKISIRIGQNYHSYFNGNIGYEIDREYRGNHYALEAAELVLQVARFHGMKSLYITCEEDNAPSYKTIESLGGILEEITEIPRDYFGWYEGIPEHRIYRLELLEASG